MHPAEFERAARTLARPCTLLRDRGADYAALWGSEAVVPAPQGPYRHWLSIDARHLPAGARRRGVLSIFSNEADHTSGTIVWSEEAALPPPPAGSLALFAWQTTSLPPIEAVFAFGGANISAWLAEIGWGAVPEYNSNFPDRAAVEPYEESFQASCPLYTGEAHAVLGGWHFPWPDGDWMELVDASLLVWTLAQSEPWLEAWVRADKTWVSQRVT